MDQKLCEICSSEAKLVCFCRRVLLCEMCIGKHFLAEQSAPHKPIALSQTDMAKVYEERHAELMEDEERLLEELHNQKELAGAKKAKVEEALASIAALEVRIDEVVAAAEEALCREVHAAAGALKDELAGKSKTVRETLESIAREEERVPDSPIVKAVAEAKTVAEMQSLELVKWRLEADEVHASIGEVMRKAIHFSLETPLPRKLPHSKTLEGKRSQPEPALKPTKTISSVKKPTTPSAKLDPRHQPSAFHGKSQSTLTQPKGAKSETPSKKPTMSLLPQPKKDVYGRRSTAFDFSPFPILPDLAEDEAKSDEDFNLLADDDEGEAGSSGRQLFMKMPTEVPRSKGSPGRQKHSRSPAAAKVKTALKEAESGIGRGKRPTSDNFQKTVVHSARDGDRQSPPPQENRTSKHMLAPPTINVTPPEDHRPRTPRRSVCEEPPRQVSKATEVSRSPTQFSPIGCDGEGQKKSAALAFPQQTYIIPPGGNLLKVLDLDSNTTSIKEFSLPESERFGLDLAWCCSLYGEVFLLGGLLGEEVLNCIYIYNPGSDELEGGCSMMQARYRHCALYYQDSIYALGGIGSSRQALRDCERFDIRKKGHKRIGLLAHARESHSACIFEGKIYVAGGTRSDVVEVMVPQTEVFTQVHLKIECSGPAALFADGDKIVIIHNNQVTYLWPNDRSTKEAGKLAEYDWWCQGPAITCQGLVYLVKQGCAYRYDPVRVEIEKIEGVEQL